MPTFRASAMLGREVRYRGIKLGVVADVLIDLPSRRALGFEVACGDDARRFLPLAASEAVDDRVDVPSALVLLDELFYRERSQSFRSLRGTVARRGALELGVTRDFVIESDARVVAAVVDSGGRIGAIRLDPSVSLGAGTLRPAV